MTESRDSVLEHWGYITHMENTEEKQKSNRGRDLWRPPALTVSSTWGHRSFEKKTGKGLAHTLEKWLIESALDHAGGNQTAAAELLGLTRDQVRYRMAKYKIPSTERA